MTNPFMNRGMLQSEEDFFGRRKPLADLEARTLSVSKPQSCSIVGPRRIGKSSLLWNFAHVAGASGVDDSLYRVYVDLQASRAMTEAGFFKLLRKRLKRALPGELWRSLPGVEDEPGPDSLEEIMEGLAEEDVKVVFLLDEFDKITGNDAFGVEVFSCLRYMANSLPMALITSSVQELQELCHSEDIRESPFFNIFTLIPLGLFTAEEAEEMLDVLSARGGKPFSAEEKEFALGIGGRHPFFLQMAACHIWDLRQDPDWRRAGHDGFMREARPHFQYMLRHLRSQERDALISLAGHREYVPDRTTGRHLRRQSLVQEEGGRMIPFSDALQEYLLALEDEAEPVSAEAGLSRVITQSISAAVEIQPGVRVHDRYQLQECLGRGGFGVVHLAKDTRLGRLVAVKFLFPRNSSEPEEKRRDRFQREARTLAQLDHPHVIGVSDFGVHETTPFLVMEYFPGRPLLDVLDEEGPLPRNDALRIMKDVTGALVHAHGVGVVHRDIAPTNILVSKSGSVKIVDFGMAFQEGVSRLTSEGVLLFNPRYCAPERLQQEPMAVDGRADIFSLGCVLYELCTGKPIFDGKTTTNVVSQILSGDSTEERLETFEKDEPLRRIIRRCLQVDPEGRYADAEQLLEALEQVSKEETRGSTS